MPIRCEIVSQDRTVFEGNVDIVVLPGGEGEMGILPKHTPLLTTLKFGVVKVRTKSQEQIFTVSGGVAEVQPDSVIVLADAAENVQEIDVVRAEVARKRAEEALVALQPEQDQDTYLALQAALRRSDLRLEAVRRYRSGKHTTLIGE